MAAKNSSTKKRITKSRSEAAQATLDRETARNISKIAEIEETQKEQRSTGEKISELIAAFCGSMTFVWVHVVWFTGWVLLNSLFPATRFDPFPYTFLTLVVSLEAIFLSTFILISQNHETQITERRNHLDLQINLLAEQESTKTLELLQLVARKVGVALDDEGVDALLEPIEPGKLIEQIKSAKGDDDPRQVKREPNKNGTKSRR